MRLLTYNIMRGGIGRERRLAAVIASCEPDVVVLQEATVPEVVRRLAQATGLSEWGARPRHSVAFISRATVADATWRRPPWSRRSFLELVLRDGGTRLFGVHLTAVHAGWTERLRVRELRAVLRSTARYARDFHIVAGDFNTLAPGERLDVARLPRRLRWLVWLSGGHIRWATIKMMLEAQYVDAYRYLNGDERGFTFPSADRHIRLDYAFVPAAFASRLTACRVVADHAEAAAASDHLPLLVEW